MMPTQPFDELVDRLRHLNDGSSNELREALAGAATEACEVLDRAHAAYVAVGGVETGAELLAMVDARTRLLAAADGEACELRCDAVKELDSDAYDHELAKLAPVIEVVLQTRLGDAWSGVASPDAPNANGMTG